MALILVFEATNTGVGFQTDGPTVVSEESLWKRAVRAASTANVVDPLTAAPATIDGVTLADDDRILLKDQSTASTNGIYRRVSASVWERASDYEVGALVEAGIKVYSQEGTANAKKTWRMITTGTITVGTDPTSWEEDGGGGGGASAWSVVLGVGNTSGGTNPEISAGDKLKGEDQAGTGPGNPLILEPGAGSVGYYHGALQALQAGNTRGAGAVDFQMLQSAVTDVAGSILSVLAGGYYNRIDSGYENNSGAIIGGASNRINSTGYASNNYNVFIGGGRNNDVGPLAVASAVFGYGNNVQGGPYYVSESLVAGYLNSLYASGVTGSYRTALFGRSNTVTSSQNSLVTGLLNNVYGAGSSFTAGASNDVNAQGMAAFGQDGDSHTRADWSVMAGRGAYTYVPNQYASGTSDSATFDSGKAQRAFYILSKRTTQASPAELTPIGSVIPGTGNRLFIRPSRAYMIKILVSAYQTGGSSGTTGDAAGWEIEGLIRRDGANNTVAATFTGTGTPAFTIGAGSGTWNVAVAADDTNESLLVTVTGQTNKTIMWVAHVIDAEAGG